MYSFYGGQKGQDFRITHIFPNRSEGLLKDLQARWYSPINVGDYVFINYGDIAQLGETVVDSDGTVHEIETTYNKNLNIDLLNCGKSYTNSIWQKIYVDENKEISPDFPDSEENVYIFINFEDDEPEIKEEHNIVNNETITTYYVMIDGKKQFTDAEGNWLNQNGEVIRNRRIPGESLTDFSDLYTDEHFGFGYRLIACVTGQTPRIKVYHQTINIEDGDPYVTYDLTNPDKPEIKFYQQRSQQITKTNTKTLSSKEKPYVYLNTKTDGATLTYPTLEFELPRALHYHFGLLFGEGELAQYPYLVTNEESASEQIECVSTYTKVLEISKAASLFGQRVLNIELNENNSDTAVNFGLNEDKLYYKIHCNNFIQTLKNIINEESFAPIQKYFLPDNNFYSRLENQPDDITLEEMPWGQYGMVYHDDYLINENFTQYKYGLYSSLSTSLDLIRDFISNKDEESLDKLPNGIDGFLSRDDFNTLNLDEKLIYCNNYVNGLTQNASIVMLTNLLAVYTPLVNVKQILIDITLNEERFYLIEKSQFTFIRTLLSQLSSLKDHYNLLLKQVMPGDLYINTPSGRIYQISNITNKVIKSNYLGTLTAPAPIVETEYTTPYLEVSDPEGNKSFTRNTIQVFNNLLIKNSELGYRESYVFALPREPIFTVSSKAINNKENPSVDYKIIDAETSQYNFNLPKAIHFYHTGDKYGSYWDESAKIPRVTSGELSKDDYFIHLTDKFSEEERGYIYSYQGVLGWIKCGTLRGPTGIPQPVKTIKLRRVTSVPSGTLVREEENGEVIYKFNNQDSLEALIDQFNIELDGYPNNGTGEVYTFNVYLDSESISESYWGSYYKEEQLWSLTLMTGNSVLSNSKIEDNSMAKSYAYTASYLNSVIPEWDIVSYY